MAQDILEMHLKGNRLKEESRWTRVQARSDWCGRWCHKSVPQHNADDTHTGREQTAVCQQNLGKVGWTQGRGFCHWHQPPPAVVVCLSLFFLSKVACPPTYSDNCEEKFNLVICKSVNILARVTCTQCCSVLPSVASVLLHNSTSPFTHHEPAHEIVFNTNHSF